MGYQEIDELSLYNIIDRLRLTVELMTAANEIHKDYLKILQLTAVLLFAKDFSYEYDMADIKYISCHHSYVDLLQNPPIILSQMRKQEEFDGDFFAQTRERRKLWLERLFLNAREIFVGFF